AGDRHRPGRRLRSRRGSLQEGDGAQRADPRRAGGGQGAAPRGDRSPARPEGPGARRPSGIAMIRALAVALALATSGCVMVLSSPFSLLGRDRPLEEKKVAGEGRDKVLVLDVTGVITDEPSRRSFGLIEEESTVARVQAELDKASGDDRVRAIVLRV